MRFCESFTFFFSFSFLLLSLYSLNLVTSIANFDRVTDPFVLFRFMRHAIRRQTLSRLFDNCFPFQVDSLEHPSSGTRPISSNRIEHDSPMRKTFERRSPFIVVPRDRKSFRKISDCTSKSNTNLRDGDTKGTPFRLVFNYFVTLLFFFSFFLSFFFRFFVFVSSPSNRFLASTTYTCNAAQNHRSYDLFARNSHRSVAVVRFPRAAFSKRRSRNRFVQISRHRDRSHARATKKRTISLAIGVVGEIRRWKDRKRRLANDE